MGGNISSQYGSGCCVDECANIKIIEVRRVYRVEMEVVQTMNDWKATDIVALLDNSIEIRYHRKIWLIYVMFCLCCTAAFLKGISEMLSHDGKFYLCWALFVFLLLCSPFLIYCFRKAFVYDKNPMAYVLTEVILKESHDRNWMKFFTIRFQDENGCEFVADTDAIFSTNGIAKPQFRDCTGRKARIAYHKGIRKVYILEII